MYSAKIIRLTYKSMEDLEPLCTTEQASFCTELMRRLNIQRAQNYLCDITLVAKEGKEFKAHMNVLSAASPFFAKLLQSGMKEKETGIIRLDEISDSTMEDVLEFIYTGSVDVNEDNVDDLVIATDYLLLVNLKTVSLRFLEQQLSTANCISTFYFAEKYHCEELVTNSRKFVYDNFVSVAELDEFLNLEAEEVSKWISSDDICVAAEEDVFNVILKWVEQNKGERKANFEELFRHVRLVSMMHDHLLDVARNELVRDNPSCVRKVLDALEIMSSASENTFLQSPRKRVETHVIVARGGKYTFCHLPEKGQWKRMADGLSATKGLYTKMIKFRDQLYAFPGISSAERCDPLFNSWGGLDVALSYLMDHVVVVGGQIFSLEINVDENKTTVNRFDSNLSTWKTVLSRGGCRMGSCVVGADDCMYVFGGRSSGGPVCVATGTAERFNTVETNWETIADMQQPRRGAFGVATQGRVFVAGGILKQGEVLDSCEVYNVSTDEWYFIANLTKPRYVGSMVCVNGTLYVLGGSGTQSYEFSVESYDSTANRWTQKTAMPVDRFPDARAWSYKGCAMNLSKGMLAKLPEI